MPAGLYGMRTQPRLYISFRDGASPYRIMKFSEALGVTPSRLVDTLGRLMVLETLGGGGEMVVVRVGRARAYYVDVEVYRELCRKAGWPEEECGWLGGGGDGSGQDGQP